ncbi:MAG: NAD-dependent epimerase/dehydratase family protein [Bacteroidota bacterium]
MKVIITGATGMVGKGVLLECLDHESITEVLSISRRSVGISHPKLKELLHPDFSEFESAKEALQGYDACYACMGVSSAGMNETEYTRLTYDFTLALAKVLFNLNPSMAFTYVSGQGTDSTESSSTMWARVKGKTENDLLALGFQQAFMFRPGMIIPVKGVSPSSKLYRVVINNMTWLLKLLKYLAPNSVVNTAQIGQAMIKITQSGYDKNIIAPTDILQLSNH